MKMTYNAEEDTLRILFRNAPIHESEVHHAGLILDFDQHGKIVSIELASASTHISRPHIAGLHIAPVVAETELLSHDA